MQAMKFKSVDNLVMFSKLLVFSQPKLFLCGHLLFLVLGVDFCRGPIKSPSRLDSHSKPIAKIVVARDPVVVIYPQCFRPKVAQKCLFIDSPPPTSMADTIADIARKGVAMFPLE